MFSVNKPALQCGGANNFVQLPYDRSTTYWVRILFQLFSCNIYLGVIQVKLLNCTCIKSCRNRKEDFADN